jgi:hypothetical protein
MSGERDMFLGLHMYAAAVNEAALRGGGRAGLMLLNDVQMAMPTVPKDEGTLRGSGTIHVQSKLVKVAENVGGDPTPNIDSVETPPPGIIQVTVGFNTPYAAVQHEGEWKSGPLAGVQIENYTEPCSGAKFIEQKLADGGDDYFEAFIAPIRTVHGGAGAGVIR